MEQILDDFSPNDDNKLNDWSTFVQFPHDTYYVNKWVEIEGNIRSSFNIGAFFFGAFWMLYRKMYKEAILLLVLIFIEASIEEYLIAAFNLWEYEIIMNIVSNLGIATIVGFLGNRIYLNSTNRKIKELKALNTDLPAYELALAHVGGTSWTAVFIGFILYFLFFAILFASMDLF